MALTVTLYQPRGAPGLPLVEIRKVPSGSIMPVEAPLVLFPLAVSGASETTPAVRGLPPRVTLPETGTRRPTASPAVQPGSRSKAPGSRARTGRTGGRGSCSRLTVHLGMGTQPGQLLVTTSRHDRVERFRRISPLELEISSLFPSLIHFHVKEQRKKLIRCGPFLQSTCWHTLPA